MENSLVLVPLKSHNLSAGTGEKILEASYLNRNAFFRRPRVEVNHLLEFSSHSPNPLKCRKTVINGNGMVLLAFFNFYLRY
jgi:hypothetical protein